MKGLIYMTKKFRLYPIGEKQEGTFEGVQTCKSNAGRVSLILRSPCTRVMLGIIPPTKT